MRLGGEHVCSPPCTASVPPKQEARQWGLAGRRSATAVVTHERLCVLAFLEANFENPGMELLERSSHYKTSKARVYLDLQAVHHLTEREASLRQFSG